VRLREVRQATSCGPNPQRLRPRGRILARRTPCGS
jgi:hypothetical protein